MHEAITEQKLALSKVRTWSSSLCPYFLILLFALIFISVFFSFYKHFVYAKQSCGFQFILGP